MLIEDSSLSEGLHHPSEIAEGRCILKVHFAESATASR
jgi:hypothetical protein